MRVLSVARKLLVGSVAANTLVWGVGGINIDGTRIATDRLVDDPRLGGNGTWRTDEMAKNVYAGRRVESSVHGRWPANLIFQHKSGCRCVGGRQVQCSVPASGVALTKRDCKQVGAWGFRGTAAPPACHASPDGTETVPAWECEPGCPVGELDAEVGVLKSGTVKPGYMRNSTSQPNRGGYKGGFGDSHLTGFGDSGGASRFFKQVQDTQETTAMAPDLIEYLTTLVSSPDGQAVYVEDLATLDLTEIPDDSLYGLIAGGHPTEAQVKGAMRVLRPGAHFLLIAPKDQPTGHTGACLLEDTGFEIRDSILLVTEPGRFHYVPKASRSEREAGCFNLPAKSGAEAVDREEDTAGLNSPRAGAGRTANSVHNHHPTVKAIDLMTRLLADVPKDKGPVLDPFLGSGTTLISCLTTGHDAIGIEREEEYIRIADARVRFWDSETVRRGETVIESDCPKAPEAEEIDFLDMLTGDR